MRRLLSFAAFAVFLALIPAQGQRHAGGGGGRAMASAGHAGGFTTRGSSGHALGTRGGGFAAPRGRSGFGHSFRSSFHQPGFHQPDRGGSRDGRRGFRARDFGFRLGFRDCLGCRRWRGYPGWYAGYYDPYWWWDSGSSYDQDQSYETGLANEMNQQSLEEHETVWVDLHSPRPRPHRHRLSPRYQNCRCGVC